ncbi:MAG: M28 family peptidase, partial [Candidatus Heimdallarchaeota archaeon]|nr:M28 family peptidase [Candidatus Heimdallarchaeota archaeon]
MNESIKQVDVENLYQHVLTTEGVKHPLVNPEKLNETSDYIKSEFQKYGLNTNEQSFKIEGTDMTFRNIEGYIGDGSKPEILVTSHYDTVRNAPGANDNGSAVAAMLEAARVLSQEYTGSVRFISFTLEELQPTIIQQEKDKGLELGIIDESYRYTSYHSQKMIQKLFSKVSMKLSKG